MSKKTRLRLRRKGGITEMLVLVRHPMEDGRRFDGEVGQPVSAHYIERMTFSHNGRVIAELRMGPDVAANPLVGIAVEEVVPGDRVGVAWTDNRGESDRVAMRVT